MNVRTIAATACGLLLAGLATALFPAPLHAQTSPQYYFYKLGTHDLTTDRAIAIGRSMDLVPAVQAPAKSYAVDISSPVQTFKDANGIVCMVYWMYTGQFKLFTDYTRKFGAVPSASQAETDAQTFFEKNGMWPSPVTANIGTWQVSEVVTTGTQSWQAPVVGAGGGGAVNSPTDILQTVNYYLQVDGMRVVGPDFKQSAEVSSNGVGGFAHQSRELTRIATLPKLISQETATAEFDKQFAVILSEIRVGDPDTTARVISTDMVYFEQGEAYVQPAYRYQVVLTGSGGSQIGQTWFVAAASNSPEGIKNVPTSPFEAAPITVPPTDGGNTEALPRIAPGAPSTHIAAGLSVPAKKKIVYDPIDFAVYEVRDDNRFLDGANGFIGNLEMSNLMEIALTFGAYPQTVLNQYYWDEPWMWENDPVDGVPDNSQWFVGANSLVLYEGHGAPWEVSTYSNCCNLIYYPTIPGYGAYHDSEITNYILWHTCDSIPAPGDPYGGDYASPAGPFDVWFTIFKGMRGTYGARTTVNIYDGVDSAFGASAGYGVPNLSNWLNAEANCATGHGGGWNYGCCVISAGHENDCIYDTGSVDPPGTLTMYWQHS